MEAHKTQEMFNREPENVKNKQTDEQYLNSNEK